MFPNPADDATTLEATLAEGAYTIEVIDLNGRTILTQDVDALVTGLNQFKVNVSGLGNGMYVIGLQGKADTYTRLMIAH